MKSESPQISLPKSWSKHVRAAILHVISLAQFATAHTRSWAANSVNARIRLKAERDLKTLCPTMGKVKIAQTLARAGLHLGATTVGRMLREDAAPKPRPKGNAQATGRILTAKYRDQIWHVDLTAVPTGLGFWVPWLPFALPQQFSFCWWVGVVVDHFFRRVMGIGVFAKRPNRQQFCAFLGRTIARTAKPKYIICDRDCIFDCHAFRSWVKRKGIQPPRYGAAGKHGSIAVVERFILSMKTELTRSNLGPHASRSVSAGTTLLPRMVQRAAATHNARRQDAKRSRTLNVGQLTGDRASNREGTGHVVRLVRSRRRWWLESPVTRSPFASNSRKVGVICPSFR